MLYICMLFWVDESLTPDCMSDPRLFVLFLFTYNSRVLSTSRLRVRYRCDCDWSCSEDEQVASAFIYYYMELYVYSAVQCQLQWHLLLLYDNNERQCSEALCTKNIAHWSFHYVINCDTLISYLLSLFWSCTLSPVLIYRLWKILISLRDSYSRRVPSLSSGAR